METTYIVVSPRVGVPGEPYEPAMYVNLHALLEAGFIRRASDAAPPEPTKVKKKRPDTEPTE
jgi:hypothetical protein